MAEAKKRYIVSKDQITNDMYSVKDGNTYVMKENTAKNEAALLFSGEFVLSNKVIRATKGDNENKKFQDAFAYLKRAIDESDLSVAHIDIKESLLGKQNLYKRLPEFITAAHECGFSAFIYNGNSKDLNNIQDSVKQHSHIMKKDECLASIFIVNDIAVGLVHFDNSNFNKLQEEINEIKSKVEFIFVISKAVNKDMAKKVANAGADYIVMYGGEIKPYYIINTDDGRNVKVMGSLGIGLGDGLSEDNKSILLKVRLIRDYDGKISIEDEYIPCKCVNNVKNLGYIALPTNQYYSNNYHKKFFAEHNKEIKKLVGTKLKVTSKKKEIKNKNGFQPQVSIREICEILGASTDFYTGSFPLDEKVHSIIIRKTELDKDCVAVIEHSEKKSKISAEDAVKAKALFIISDKMEMGLPTLVVKGDPKDAYIKLVKAIRDKYDPFTVGITGTVGKSTTTDLIKKTIGYGYNLLDVRGNYNYYRTVGFCIQKLSPNHNAYVQELHGGTKGAAKLGSNMILPNACVITNIGDAHLSQVGTVEDVLREKLGIIDSLQPGGILVVNNDNEYLQNLDLPVKVVTYGIYNHDSDYHAENVVDYGDHVEFTIVCDEGNFDAVVYCPGIHNVGNAMAAFAVGRFAGIEPHRIIAAISRYRTAGVRQNIVAMDGYKIIADCFSATPDSMLSSLGSFKNLKTKEGGKHIAVIGDVADLGKKSKSWHREFGKRAYELGIDVLITLGEEAATSAEAARELGMEAYDFIDRDEFENKICEIMRPGDNLLFKSSHPVDLAKSVDNLFGIK